MEMLHRQRLNDKTAQENTKEEGGSHMRRLALRLRIPTQKGQGCSLYFLLGDYKSRKGVQPQKVHSVSFCGTF